MTFMYYSTFPSSNIQENFRICDAPGSVPYTQTTPRDYSISDTADRSYHRVRVEQEATDVTEMEEIEAACKKLCKELDSLHQELNIVGVLYSFSCPSTPCSCLFYP
ncbi:hypothetical protein MRB53_037819 [Persea americana]|nr:hypothetical protein MRB53_037819 [Persea americana]